MGEQFEKVDVRHRARWSESTARGVLSAWRASGMSQAGFAAREGIAPQRLSWWRKRLGEWEGERGGLKLVPAVIRERAVALATPTVAVRLPEGVVIELGSAQAVPASWLGELVRELRRA